MLGKSSEKNSVKRFKHVCLFCDSFLPEVGGMEYVIHHIAKALVGIGLKTTVIAKKNAKGRHFDQDYSTIYYGYSFPFCGRIGLDTLSALMTVRKGMINRRYDVVHCHSVSYAGGIIALGKKIWGFPLVMTPHGEDIQRIPEIGYGLRLKSRWDRRIRKNLSVADAVTAISSSVQRELDFIPKSKIYAIPNGIDLREFDGEPGRFLHKELGIDRDIKIVLSVGRNHTKKGYEYGIKAFDILEKRKQCRDLVYVIIGRDTEELKSIVAEHSLGKRVFVLPEKNRPSIVKSYKSAWCFFSPSIVEAMSLVSIEAMACGLPLVVTDVAGNIDVVQENGCGIVVKKQDAVSMADGILKLVSEGKLYDEFRRAAVNRAPYYDWSNIAKKYVKVYEKAMNNCNGMV